MLAGHLPDRRPVVACRCRACRRSSREFLVLAGRLRRTTGGTPSFAVLGIVLAALYILLMYQRTMTGPVRPSRRGMRDLDGREVARWRRCSPLIIVLGFFPKPLLDVINPPSTTTLTTSAPRTPGRP